MQYLPTALTYGTYTRNVSPILPTMSLWSACGVVCVLLGMEFVPALFLSSLTHTSLTILTSYQTLCEGRRVLRIAERPLSVASTLVSGMCSGRGAFWSYFWSVVQLGWRLPEVQPSLVTPFLHSPTTHIPTYSHTQMHTCTHTHIHTNTLTHIHTYAHTHTHTHHICLCLSVYLSICLSVSLSLTHTHPFMSWYITHSTRVWWNPLYLMHPLFNSIPIIIIIMYTSYIFVCI
jgi:hypothetical protein